MRFAAQRYALGPHMPRLAARRLAYYAAVLIGTVVVHQGFVVSIGGSGVSDLLRRNSEAYLMMVILPAYWDIFAWAVDPDGRGATARIGSDWRGQAAWFGGLAIVALVLQSTVLGPAGIGLPQAVVTLGEAFVAAIVICLYLGWSRAILPGRPHTITGAAVVGVPARLGYYAAVAGAAIVIQQAWFASLAGQRFVDWLQVNIEAYAAMLLVPAYYDVVAPGVRRWMRPAWYTFLVAAPMLVQSGVLDGVVAESILGWLGRTTEAFIAAFVISAYTDVVRGRWSGHDAASPSPEVPDSRG